ncbi:uncharacterized protein LOC118498400 [Phyllostomus discolor]|uniref:Uncharacterized protein LOC118498400 n=1 Tax=Phyllostomus discolor TaxID=89673 RepID=A0A7E6CZ23_9CHIR|nr:uncharacterized protein LOC118498400 [Phyllostomus discolor]
MDTLSSCQTASLSELLPNGYLAQTFPGCPEVEGLAGEVELEDSEQCGQGDFSPREDSGQGKKKTKVNKIWNFVSRRRGASSHGKRPQSMILLGATSKSSELKPKVTLMDRMKSFKKLKPSTGGSKTPVPRSSKAQEPQEPPSSYRMRKNEETAKPFRHSYAGHVEGPEPFLTDAQRPAHIPSRVNPKVLASQDSVIQVEEDPCEEEAPEQSGSRGGRWAKTYVRNVLPGDQEAPHIAARNSRIEELEVTVEGSSLEGSYEESPGHLRRDKATPFGGVVKFFSNMAEVARKWRAFSREEPQISRRHRRREACLVRDSEVFIMETAASQTSLQLDPPCGLPDTEMFRGVIKKRQHWPFKSSKTSRTFTMSLEGEELADRGSEAPRTTAALAWASTSAAFEFQDDPIPQEGYSYHYSGSFVREPSSSDEADDDTETVISFVKEDDSSGEFFEVDTCVKKVTFADVLEKPREMEEEEEEEEEEEASRAPMGSNQAGQPQKSDLGKEVAGAESEASKACAGVSGTQEFFPPAEPPPRTPPLKVLLARCQSLPVSQNIPLDLDQLYLSRPPQLGAVPKYFSSLILKIHL